MENCNCKVTPGFEKYQSKAEQEKQALSELGMFNPAAFNPSEQEVSLQDRLASKLDAYQEKEYGLAPVAPMLGMLVSSVSMSGRGKGRGR